MLDIKRNVAILNIFKNDLKHIEEFIVHHAPLVNQLLMMDTGSTDGSYERALEVAGKYSNVGVCSFPMTTVNFAAFRNQCLEYFEIFKRQKTTHYFWVDTDERLQGTSFIIPPADIYSIERTDSSGRFSTWLQRGFSSTLEGKWEGLVHEGFIVPSPPPETKIAELKLLHLESEMERPQEKKLLYFDLINRQLREYVAVKNWDRARQYACLAMLMASYDFEEPALCVKLFDLHGYLLQEPREVYTISELNALIHVVRSCSRMGEDVVALGEWVISLHPAKSTVYQVLRGLLLNFNNTPWVKSFYETQYQALPDNLVPEFFNADFSLPEQVALFERRIARQQHWLSSGYLQPTM